ncbi:radical SAM protein [bacterium]|nr:radical SAM protein [candidate division CSSED10-310 bacterium]
MNNKILLIYPPVARNSEPPLGISLIAGYLKSLDIPVKCIDLNGYWGPHLAHSISDSSKTRYHRAKLHIKNAIEKLSGKNGYSCYSRYQTQMEYYSGALACASENQPWMLTPGDFKISSITGFGVHDIETICSSASELPFKSLYDAVLEPVLTGFSPGITGISICYRSQFVPSIALGVWLKHCHPNMTIVFGGPFCRMLPEASRAYIDFILGNVILEDGERFFKNYLDLGKSAEDGEVVPDFSDYHMNLYFTPEAVLPITSSRGCYWRRCAFCSESNVAFRMDKQDVFLQKLHTLYEISKPSLLHFTDNALPPTILDLLARETPPVPFYGFVRPTMKLTNKAFIQKLKDNGCRMLELGMETAVQKHLDRMQKGTCVSDYGRILDNLHASGIKSFVYILFGFPGETETDRNTTLEFLTRHPITFLNTSIFRYHPGTRFANDIPEEHLPADSLVESSIYVKSEEQKLPELRRWMDRVYYKHPVIRKLTQKTPRFFKSNHAVFFD